MDSVKVAKGLINLSHLIIAEPFFISKEAKFVIFLYTTHGRIVFQYTTIESRDKDLEDIWTAMN